MLSEGLSNYAELNGIGTKGTDLFVRQMPDSPDNAICIYDETGFTVVEQQDYDIDIFGSQWLMRGSYSFVKQKCIEIHRLISALGNIELDNIGLVSTQILSVPAFVENDKKGRAVYSAHYLHYANIGASDNRFELNQN